MNRTARALLLFALAALFACAPASAQAAFGIEDFDVSFEADPAGSEPLAAGSHPYAMTTSFSVATEPAEGGGVKLSEALKDLIATQVEGLAGNPTAVEPCSNAGFLTRRDVSGTLGIPDCPDASAVGTVEVFLVASGELNEQGISSAVYNLTPSPGRAARLGFWTEGVPVTISLGVSEEAPYRILGGPENVSEIVEVYGSTLTLWGVPADERHDELRGFCVDNLGESRGICPYDGPEKPFLTLPRTCQGPLPTDWRARSWAPGSPWISGFALTHDAGGNPQGFSACGELDFGPSIAAQPTSLAASSPTGLAFNLDVNQNQGLHNPEGVSAADIAKTVVTLPEGMTANPSQAEGLAVCSEGDLAGETAFSEPGEGCPQASKIGTVEVETPLLEEKTIKGALYVAEPYANPFGTLLALYMVVKEPKLGIKVTQPLKVEPDPKTGQLLTTAEDIIPVPLSHVRLRLREGGRSPLITPRTCGTHEVRALLYPSSGAAPISSTSSFALTSGPNGSPCPSGPAPFEPGFTAGAQSNAAGSYSPFQMRLTRRDGDQDLTRFDAVLPPGVLAKLAGVARCPDTAIAAAKAKTGKGELATPSCPAGSEIGSVTGGAGVGSQLTYVPGKVYLAGPVGGAPLSVVGIVPAVAGPFDVGTIVVRQALALDPVTAQAKVDGAASDPIPHILAGIPLSVRDIQVDIDRPDFTLNPTGCEPSATLADIWGGGSDLFSTADDAPVGRDSRFQAASCASLGFSPRLGIKLRGGVRRGAHPALRAIVTPPPGQANFSRAVVTLPRSAFLDQAHIRTICTRVQFAAGAGNGSQCPPGSVYGKARAWSPLLDAPAEGPVYLRSSNNNLPDLVVALKGPASAPVEVELSARIDSVRGGIRSTFTAIPDVPVSRFILDMQGGKKGLIVNSRNLCHKPGRNRARANIRGQNGRLSRTKPRVVATTCAKRRKAKPKRAKRSTGHLARASALR